MATYKGEEINLTPTATMAEEARRGLDWRREHGRGGTAVGVARARQIVNREELSPRTVRRMVSFFARHEVDKQAEGFYPGEDGYPSAGRIAWALWSGDAGKAWAIIAIRSVPLATVDGIPKRIIIGRLIKEPPPATVFITPAAVPAKVSDKIIATSFIIDPPFL